MLVQDIVKFYILLVLLAAGGSALETDICNFYPDNADNVGVECDPIGDYYSNKDQLYSIILDGEQYE